MSMFSDVRDFHIAFGQLVAEAPALPTEAIRSLRCKLLAEEKQEFVVAEEAHDFIEVADALADMVYIINGTLVSYGLRAKEDFRTLLSNSIDRPGFPSGHGGADIRSSLVEKVLTHFQSYLAAEAADDLGAISEALQNLLEAIYVVAHIYSIPLLAVFTEVHRSNMAKLVDGRVLRREDGKIIKPPGWTPPDIAGVLYPAEAA
jgi:predicted HAD superfamily Cof-like phosphohydrolase